MLVVPIGPDHLHEIGHSEVRGRHFENCVQADPLRLNSLTVCAECHDLLVNGFDANAAWMNRTLINDPVDEVRILVGRRDAISPALQRAQEDVAI